MKQELHAWRSFCRGLLGKQLKGLGTRLSLARGGEFFRAGLCVFCAHHLPFWRDFWNFLACSSVITESEEAPAEAPEAPEAAEPMLGLCRFICKAFACLSASSRFFDRNFPSSSFFTTDRACGSRLELKTTVKLTSSPTSQRCACRACKYTS